MRKFDNFCAALNNLKDIYNYNEPYENVILTGLVALFGICFEQSWKAMKEVLEEQGFAEGKTGSPKKIFKTAYQAGIIEDEEIWLNALAARNNVAHAYNHAVAFEIVRQTKEDFYTMFVKLKDEIEDNWL